MGDPAAERAGISERDLSVILGPGELAPVGQLTGAMDIRIETDDPWLRLLPPRRMPDDTRIAFQEVRAACHGSADVIQLRERLAEAADGRWLVSVIEPDEPREWIAVQLRVVDGT